MIGILSGTSSEGFIWGMSGLVVTPREDSSWRGQIVLFLECLFVPEGLFVRLSFEAVCPDLGCYLHFQHLR